MGGLPPKLASCLTYLHVNIRKAEFLFIANTKELDFRKRTFAEHLYVGSSENFKMHGSSVTCCSTADFNRTSLTSCHTSAKQREEGQKDAHLKIGTPMVLGGNVHEKTSLVVHPSLLHKAQFVHKIKCL